MSAPKLPKEIVVDWEAEKLLVDGEPFPWHVSAEPLPVVTDTGGDACLGAVTLTLLAERVVVKGTRP